MAEPLPNELLIGGRYYKVTQSKKAKTKKQQLVQISKVEEQLQIRGGRKLCYCDGTTHKALLNCLQCGKIHCEQERIQDSLTKEFFNCIFCDAPFTTAQQQQFQPPSTTSITPSNSTPKTSNNSKLVAKDVKLVENSGEKNYQKAVENRDKLLKFDTDSKTNYVIDDQLDYYESESNKWLSETERKDRAKVEADIRNQKEKLKRPQLRLGIDFSGRVVLETSVAQEDGEIKKLKQSLQTQTFETTQERQAVNPNAIDPSRLDVKLKLSTTSNTNEHGKGIFAQVQQDYFTTENETYANAAKKTLHTAHKEEHGENSDAEEEDEEEEEEFGVIDSFDDSHVIYREPISSDTMDRGYCLAMHQPYASLLVGGIKIHEGRGWYSDFRGRLWIASTSQATSDYEIEYLRNFYDKFNRGHLFMKNFPTSVLLGCVDVVDCVSRADYVKRFEDQDQESESEYVFICQNPRRLIVPIPILNKPKIYPLDQKLVKQAQSGLRPIDPSRVKPKK